MGHFDGLVAEAGSSVQLTVVRVHDAITTACWFVPGLAVFLTDTLCLVFLDNALLGTTAEQRLARVN